MRIVFAGTPEFAAQHLAALLGAAYDVVGVLTQPDRPSGRGQKLSPSAVKQLAQQHNMPVFQPRSLRLDGKYPDDAAAAQSVLQQLNPDIMVVVAYGLILPQWALDLPKAGCVNGHASLLPRWRGAAPIQRAIEAGDASTAMALMQMEAGLDTGGVYAQTIVPINTDTTASVLTQTLAELGGSLLVQHLPVIVAGTLQAVPQSADGITYASKLSKDEAQIDWSQSAAVLARKINAFEGSLGCTATLAGQSIKLWRASAVKPDAAVVAVTAGQVGDIVRRDKSSLWVQCGDGVLSVLEAQKAGGKRLPIAQFLQGF